MKKADIVEEDFEAQYEGALEEQAIPEEEESLIIEDIPKEAPLFENPSGGPITFLDLGGPSSYMPYKNPVFQGADNYKHSYYGDEGAGNVEYPEGYVSFDLDPEGSESARSEEGKHITGDLENGLPQLEDNSVYGTIFAGSVLDYLEQDGLITLAKDVARVAAPGTEVVVQESVLPDKQGNPDITIEEGAASAYYKTLLDLGFQFVSATYIKGQEEEIAESMKEPRAEMLMVPVAIVVLRKPDGVQSLNMRRIKKALNMKKAQEVPKWTDPKFLGSDLYDFVKIALQKYQHQIQEDPTLKGKLID